MKRFLLATAAAVLALPSVAHAYPVVRGVYGGTSSTGPVLVDTTVNIGASTQVNHGGVGFASQDVSTYGFAFKGLDIWNGNAAHTPKKWTITDADTTGLWALGPTSSCLNTYTTPDDTLSPPTPRPCSTAAKTGPYHFTVTATDALGHVSAPATLTYAIVANTANLGDQAGDATSSVVPTSWTSGSMPNGATIALSTGANWVALSSTNTRLIFKALDFSTGAAHPVTFTWADAAKPGGLWEIELLGVKNFILNGLTFTGPGKSPTTGWINIGTNTTTGVVSDSITVQDVAIIKTANEVVVGDTSKGLWIGGTNVTVNNFRGRYLPACLTIGNGAANVTFNNTVCRYMYVNFMDVNNFDHVTMNDTYFIAPMRFNAQHADSLQFANAVNPNYLTINRIMAVQADGDAATQGPVFGGTLGGAIGYIDDSANGNPGQPGKTLHVTDATSNKALNTSGAGKTLISETDTLGQTMAPGTSTTTSTCTRTRGTTCQVSISQLLGSAANPVEIWTQPPISTQIDGAIYAGGAFSGFTLPGTAGTGFFKDFTYVKSNGYNNGQDLAFSSVPGSLATYTNGATSWNILTASGAATGNQVGLYDLQRSSWDRVSGKPCNPQTAWPGTGAFAANCTSTGGGIGPALTGGTGVSGANPTGLTLTGGSTGGAGATYALDKTPIFGVVTNKTFDFRFDYPLSGGPRSGLANILTKPQVNTGTYLLSSGYMGDELLWGGSAGGTPPANTTVSHVFVGNLSSGGYVVAHNAAVAAFDGGDPQFAVDSITTAAWRAMTDAQVVETYAAALVPKAGGTLDAGGGTGWYGALTPANDSGQICWNVAGTVWDHTKTCAQMGLVPIP